MEKLKFLFLAIFRMIWPKCKSPAVEIAEKDPSLIRDIWKAMLKNKGVVFALIYLAIFFSVGFAAVLAGLFGFPITPYSYEQIDYQAVKQGPSLNHWFGTDLIGRDIFTRVIYSIGTTVELAIMIVLFGGLIIGVALGLTAGYFGGWIDSIIMRVGELFTTLPQFLMFIFLTMTLRPRYEDFFYSLGGTGKWLIKEGILDFSMIFIVFSIFFWVSSARIIRSETLRLREMPYIDAARILGASSYRIILRHILPNLLGIITLWVFEALGSAAMSEIGISWFGLGIRPPHPSFGVMFSEISSVRLLGTYPHLLIFPGLMVSLFIFSLAFLQMKLDIILNTLYAKGGAEQ